jgi:outer membrane protein OmpA-like peptidoglycan-associated protein
MKTILTAFLTLGGLALAQAPQAPNPTQQLMVPDGGTVPVYRITVVARTMKAINYHHRSGSTRIGFQGTALMPGARGEAKVESKQGVIKIDAEMQQLGPATQFGAEYLTYVMWAVTPEGRATNVGEILLNGGKSKLNGTTELQAFGLFVTAEPYFAVTQPSDVVVMENFVRTDTTGTIEQVDAKFELLQRGQYVLNVKPSDIRPRELNPRVPLELYEARNAVQIARWTGADHYAADTFLKATQGLENAEGYLKGKAGKKPIGTVAREAVQMAEDARIITVKRIDEEQLMAERKAGADRESRAENGRAVAQSETERVTREAAGERVSARAEANRLKRDNDARMAAANTEADRLKQETDARMAASHAESDRLRQENDAQRAAAQTDLDRVGREKNQLETEKTELRAQLLLQFNTILQTRDTARGLIVNMSDVLFDTAKFSLRPEAREKLAKVAGIVSGHPGLKLDVEGHTDSVGGDDYNQELSEQRGGAVREYLIAQGMAQDSVSSRGFGRTQPVASNDTASGRQQNRRVELVISGEIIGKEIGIPIALK